MMKKFLYSILYILGYRKSITSEKELGEVIVDYLEGKDVYKHFYPRLYKCADELSVCIIMYKLRNSGHLNKDLEKYFREKLGDYKTRDGEVWFKNRSERVDAVKRVIKYFSPEITDISILAEALLDNIEFKTYCRDRKWSPYCCVITKVYVRSGIISIDTRNKFLNILRSYTRDKEASCLSTWFEDEERKTVLKLIKQKYYGKS